MDIEELQTILGVRLPTDYCRLVRGGYCDLKSPAGKYMWVFEAEWLPLEEIPDRDLWVEKPLPGLVPFAFTGAGDNWCWNTAEETTPNDYQVLLCRHDDKMAEVYAPTFASWFYRSCLDYAGCVDNDDESVSESKVYLKSWADRLDEMKQATWATHLSSLASGEPFIYQREFNGHEYAEFGYMSNNDKDRLVVQELGEQYRDTEIQWHFDD